MKYTLESLMEKCIDGKIEIAGDVEIENIPWLNYGEKITSLMVSGDLNVRGYLNVGGDLNVRGYLNVGGYLDVGGCLNVRGYLNVGGDLDVLGYLNVSGDLNVRGDLNVSGDLNVRGDLNVSGDLNVLGDLNVSGDLNVRGYLNVSGDLNVLGYIYWSHASKPKARKIISKGILPPVWQREYWGERLQVSMEGCYPDILERIRPLIEGWLKLDKWTPTERWILESHREERTC
jgi:cytoskeletal protein CcmA (bactofilin family)